MAVYSIADQHSIGGSTMEPREEHKVTKSAEQQKPEKKRHFQIVKLEERVAPRRGSTHAAGCGGNG
jgi:hypothetical protein